MKKINETFQCIWCKKTIEPAQKTCRNHCPFCFTSLHVDWNIPWDRSANCKWIMLPIAYQIKNWDIKILFKCTTCEKTHYNKKAIDDDIGNIDSFIKEYEKCFS